MQIELAPNELQAILNAVQANIGTLNGVTNSIMEQAKALTSESNEDNPTESTE